MGARKSWQPTSEIKAKLRCIAFCRRAVGRQWGTFGAAHHSPPSSLHHSPHLPPPPRTKFSRTREPSILSQFFLFTVSPKINQCKEEQDRSIRNTNSKRWRESESEREKRASERANQTGRCYRSALAFAVCGNSNRNFHLTVAHRPNTYRETHEQTDRRAVATTNTTTTTAAATTTSAIGQILQNQNTYTPNSVFHYHYPLHKSTTITSLTIVLFILYTDTFFNWRLDSFSCLIGRKSINSKTKLNLP